MKAADFTFSTQMTTEVSDVKNMVQGMLRLMLSDRHISDGLDPFTQKPALLEDALGYNLPIPLETISSWEVCVFAAGHQLYI